jgi:hypothetical protein
MLVLIAFPAAAIDGSYGVGSGIPYGGVLGINVDYNVIPDKLDLSLGIGTWSEADSSHFGSVIGGKFYFAPETSRFRPRVSCYYGNTLNSHWDYDNGENPYHYRTYKGIIAGVGFSFYFDRMRQSGLDFDFPMFILSEDNNSSNDNVSSLGIGIGYRHKF